MLAKQIHFRTGNCSQISQVSRKFTRYLHKICSKRVIRPFFNFSFLSFFENVNLIESAPRELVKMKFDGSEILWTLCILVSRFVAKNNYY